MKLKNLLSLAAIALVLITSCKKSDSPEVIADEETVVPSAGPISVFHSNTEYYQLYVYRYEDSTSTWSRRIGSHFSSIAEATSTALGFTNTTVVNSGVNLFGMVTIYQEEIGSSNNKTAKINAPAVLQFYPSESDTTTGVVKVIEQDVVVTRTDSTTFKIGISGEGTYNETTKVIDLVVKFNESNIGGATEVKRTYKLSVAALTF